MRKLVSSLAGLAGAATLVACEDPLEVRNRNNPDVKRAYSTPAGIEQVLGTSFLLVYNGNNASSTALYPAMLTASFESHAGLGNFGMGLRSGIPRLPIQNSRGNQTATENFRDFSHLSRASRTSANAIQALDRLVAAGGTLGSAAQNARARAFGFFGNGVALGNLALAYDSAAIVTPRVPTDEIPELSSYRDVMATALQLLDSAIAISAQATGSGGFPLPVQWIKGNALSQADFVRLVRSYKARYRANVARTPAERNAADWNAIIADAENGLTADLNLALEPQAGWDNGWIGTHYQFTGWHQMAPMIIGFADTSGAYDAWLATPLNDRTAFLIKTPDRRFPSGETRTEQQTNSPAVPTGKLYFRNRPGGGDTPAAPFGTSQYDFYRFQAIYNNARNGNWPFFTKAEVDMLAAEGYLRTNRIPQAATLIDRYRVPAGLPPLSGVITSLTQPVPGGRACVPRVPVGPNFTSTACGNIFEAMKWEKRMETAFTHWGMWYFDSRGWGDLAEGTFLHFPVPYQEMDARQKPFYDLGGVGGKDAAARGTYGY